MNSAKVNSGAVTALIAAAQTRLGPKGVIIDPADVAPWLTDWRGRYVGQAQAVLAPASVDEVAAVVALAAEHRVPLVPQGGNTSMVGGATPSAAGDALILSLRRMTAIRAIDAGARIAVVEAGVILSQLHDTAAGVGLRFPLTLGARGSATIGGLVASNAGGTQVLRFGTMRKLVLGLEAVMPDGGIWRGLDVLKKDNRGYDLTQLLIGAEGTLGVVTAASLTLVDAVTDRAVAWAGVAEPQAGLTLLRRLEGELGQGVESFEIVPDGSLALVLRHIPGTRAPLTRGQPWHVLIEHVAPRAAREALETALVRAIEAGLLRDAVVATSEAQATAFWHLRDSISDAERNAGPAMQHDISVPVAAMPRFMVEAAAAVEAAFPGTSASGFGHLGDGNVHFHVRAPTGAEAVGWRAGQGAAASRMVHDLVVAVGGSISAEHGIGQMKRDELQRLSDPVRLRFLSAIKRAIDPLNIMNPGKLV